MAIVIIPALPGHIEESSDDQTSHVSSEIPKEHIHN
jgi:hypothetical protein